jgi:hypothetical protein
MIPKRLSHLPPTPGDGDVYLVIVPHYWGKGPTLAAAVGEAKRAGARSLAAGPIQVLTCSDPSVYMDEFGRVMAIRGHKPVVRFRRSA